jgi:hypothetical protein
VIPEWDLTAAALREVRVLLLPSVAVLSPEAVERVLRPWVRAGGRLILSGPCGGRLDASRSHERVHNAAAMLPELCALAGVDPDVARPETLATTVGRGQVVLLPALGFGYYKQTPGERDLSAIEPAVREHLAEFGLVSGEIPRELEVSVFRSPRNGTLFVDVANLDLDPDADAAPTSQRVTLTLAVVADARRARVLQPGRAAEEVALDRTNGRLTVGPIDVASYVSVVLR